MKENQQKKYFIDYLRIVSCIGVILIHTCYIGYQTQHMPYEVLAQKRVIYMLINNIALFAVPVFLMISGYLFLDPNREIPLKKMYGKYVLRITLCIGIYGIPFSLMENVFDTRTLSVTTVIKAIEDVLRGKTWAHMWYLYTIVGIYLMTPLIKYLIRHMHRYIVHASIGVLFLYSMTGKSIPFVGIGLLYYLIGWQLCTIELKKGMKIILYIAGIGAMGVNLSYSLYSFYRNGQEVCKLADYDTWTTFFTALALFVAFNNIQGMQRPLHKGLQSLADCSFGIYLIHPVFINLTYKFLKLYPIGYSEWLSIPVFAGAFFFMSWGAVLIIKKIPYIGKLT